MKPKLFVSIACAIAGLITVGTVLILSDDAPWICAVLLYLNILLLLTYCRAVQLDRIHHRYRVVEYRWLPVMGYRTAPQHEQRVIFEGTAQECIEHKLRRHPTDNVIHLHLEPIRTNVKQSEPSHKEIEFSLPRKSPVLEFHL